MVSPLANSSPAAPADPAAPAGPAAMSAGSDPAPAPAAVHGDPGPAVRPAVATRRLVAGVLFAWGVVLMIGGVAEAEAPGAPAAIGAGVIAVGAALVAWLAGRPVGALGIAVGGTALGAVVAGWLAADEATVRLGIGGLMGLGMAGMIVLGFETLRRSPVGASAGGSPSGPGARMHLAPEVEDMLRRIDEHAMLSDNARRVLFRERELALLDEAIEEDIRDGRFDVAMTLVDELADVFGERERAESYRERVLQDRRQRHDAQRHTMLLELDGFLAHRQWRSAQEVAGRLRRTQPDPDMELEIDRRFLAARAAHKADLEAAFLGAVERGETEDAMRILRELDHYLTPDEAERFREIAGGVIKQHRENLGVQFKLAVNDHRWPEAVAIGQTIIDEFPNTKMAGEVRSMIELLRSRAAGESSGAVRMVGGTPLDAGGAS